MVTDEDKISNQIIGSAIEVHRALGPGLLESAYEECLCRDFLLKNITFERQVGVPVVYKGVSLDCGYRLDIVVAGLVIIELKTIKRFEPIHDAQLLTYLKLTKLKLGVLLNFNVPIMKHGIKEL